MSSYRMYTALSNIPDTRLPVLDNPIPHFPVMSDSVKALCSYKLSHFDTDTAQVMC